jgi:hypothetical protein
VLPVTYVGQARRWAARQARNRPDNFLATKTVAVEIARIAMTGRLAVAARVKTYASYRNRSY